MDEHMKLYHALLGMPTMDELLREHEQRQRAPKPTAAAPLPPDAHATLLEALGGAAVAPVPADAHSRLRKVLVG